MALHGRRRRSSTRSPRRSPRRAARRWWRRSTWATGAGRPRRAQRLVAELGRVDILVNNAGLNVLGNGRRMENLTPEDWDMVLRVEPHRQYNMFHAVFEPMRAQKEGSIINVISTAAKNPSGVAGMAYQSAEVRDDGLRRLARQGSVEVRHPHLQHLPGRDEHRHHAEAPGQVLATRNSPASSSRRTSPTR